MTVRSLITTEMQTVAAQQNKPLAPLKDELVLLDCGLDSLCFAILVARLEDELGYDPFSTDDDVYFPTTFGDFVQFYERAAG
jgi:acyl carrier protein